MLIIISPAKTLDFEKEPITKSFSQTDLYADSQLLIDQVRQIKAEELQKLMSISPKLADLNVERFLKWQLPFNLENAKQAILAFKGDVYTGINIDDFLEGELQQAQKKLRILSGLYGVLKPLDLIQAYRLEMGTKLGNNRGKNLYEFWGSKITDEINASLKDGNHKHLINLASNEYFKSIQIKNIITPIITPIFKDEKNGVLKVISFNAKKARGMMTRYIIKNKLENPDDMKLFNDVNYLYNQELSNESEFVFTR